ncbi:MAG: glycine betaine ABC transporter substrate-binding protein [Thermoleophilaceae bacterium]
MKQLRIILAVLALALATGLAACGDDDDEGGQADNGGGTDTAAATQIEANPAFEGQSITIGSKNFTEQKILGEVFAQGFEAAGFTVEKELNLGDEATALRALEGGSIDAYPEYTGTALLSFFDVASEDIPTEPAAAFEQARQGFEEMDLTAFPPTPFTSSNEVAVTQETAERLELETISDLEGEAGNLSLYGSPECRQRLDCLLGLQQVYGLEFEEFVPVAIDLRHEVLENGRADVSIVFTTDPQIQRNNEVLLEDDQGMFPPYNSTLVMRDQIVEEAGQEELTALVQQIQEGLTDEVMQELNARVDLDKETPEAVAQAYLSESGLIG